MLEYPYKSFRALEKANRSILEFTDVHFEKVDCPLKKNLKKSLKVYRGCSIIVTEIPLMIEEYPIPVVH